MDNMTAKEMEVVEELKRRTFGDVTPRMLEDVALFYRFSKARDFKIEDAETMLRNHISWRKVMNIDTILTDYKPSEVLVESFPTSFICFNKEGCSVRIVDLGRVDPKGLSSVETKADLGKFFSYIIEQDIDKIIKRGGNLGKLPFSIIHNFEKLSYRNGTRLCNLPVIIYLMKMYIDNYPEMLRTITMINAPSYFSGGYALVKPFLPTVVIQKMRIFGTDGWKKVLLEEINPDDLPEYLGGNRTDSDENPIQTDFAKFS